MDEKDKNEARVHAARARRQAGHAAKNTVRAVSDLAEPVMEEVEDQVEKTVETARQVSPGMLGRLGRMSTDTGIGFLSLSVCLYSGVIAYNSFRSAYYGRKQVAKPVVIRKPPPAPPAA